MYYYYYYLGASETTLDFVSIPESRRGLKGAHYFFFFFFFFLILCPLREIWAVWPGEGRRQEDTFELYGCLRGSPRSCGYLEDSSKFGDGQKDSPEFVGYLRLTSVNALGAQKAHLDRVGAWTAHLNLINT